MLCISLLKDAFQVLSTEPSTTDTTTEAPSAEALTNEKAALEEDLEKDKEELANLEAEEEAASAVDAEIDGVEAKIEQLTQGTGEDTGSQRVRRQLQGGGRQHQRGGGSTGGRLRRRGRSP